jgi:polygalacturonase
MVNSPLDDAICPKSSYALGFARATENVTITNCQVSGYVEGTLLDGTFKREPQRASGDFSSPMGRIKFGTESNGGFKNITISNCVFDYSRGIALESVDGALLEDVTITNITMREITNAPIFMRLGFRGRGPKDSTTVGALRRVIISNVVVYNAGTAISSIIAGIPGHPIEDVTLSNIRIYSKGGGTEQQAALEPVEKDDAYPEPTMFGDTPSCGFFIRNAKGLRIDQVSLSYMKDDQRPAFVLNNVTGVEFARVNAQRAGAWVDSMRVHIPEPTKLYTWWSYRSLDWITADKGSRLDHVWTSQALADRVAGINIAKNYRGATRPSDHVPVTLTLEL